MQTEKKEEQQAFAPLVKLQVVWLHCIACE